jgi:NADH:ubiquinone oxidoreductase subunit 4 (subunit M)
LQGRLIAGGVNGSPISFAWTFVLSMARATAPAAGGFGGKFFVKTETFRPPIRAWTVCRTFGDLA